MIVLDAATKSLEAKIGGAPTTDQPCFVASWQDGREWLPVGSSDGELNGATAVTVVAAPSAGDRRRVLFLSLRNRDTGAVALTVQLNNDGTIRELWSGTLAAGSTLFYRDGRGFHVLDSAGGTRMATTA